MVLRRGMLVAFFSGAVTRFCSKPRKQDDSAAGPPGSKVGVLFAVELLKLERVVDFETAVGARPVFGCSCEWGSLACLGPMWMA